MKITLSKYAKGANILHLSNADIRKLKIPLPPLKIQQEIVAEIEGYQKIIDGACAVVDNYKPQIQINPDWEMVKLGDVCEIRSGGTPSRKNKEYWNGDIPWITTTLINNNVIQQATEFITTKGLEDSSAWVAPKGAVLMAMYGEGVTRGRVATLGIDAATNQACAIFQIKNEQLLFTYLFRILQGHYEDLRKISSARGGNQSNLSAQVIKIFSIPLPPLKTQKEIVAQIEKEQSLINANKEVITLFEQKIKDKIASVWGG